MNFHEARLGTYTRGIKQLIRYDYQVCIACCSDNNHTWTTIITGQIPEEAQYILECCPRENKVNLVRT